jgi:hypothetical protein
MMSNMSELLNGYSCYSVPQKEPQICISFVDFVAETYTYQSEISFLVIGFSQYLVHRGTYHVTLFKHAYFIRLPLNTPPAATMHEHSLRPTNTVVKIIEWRFSSYYSF